MRAFPCFCQKNYTREIYHRPKPGKGFTLGACIRSATNKIYFYTGNFLVKWLFVKEKHRSLCRRGKTRKNTAKKLSNSYSIFLQGDIYNDFVDPICLGHIVPNMVNDNYQKQPL